MITQRSAADPARWTRLSSAIAFALDIHAEQTRKGAETPYIGHLLAVASLVLEHEGDEEQAMAGVLHDAIEDQGVHQAEPIRERFGERVLSIVLGCTDADTLPKPPWRARKEAYIAHLETASRDVLLVSCADKVHNARAIRTDFGSVGAIVFERFKAGRGGTLWYYLALAEVFERRLPGALSRELRETVDDLARMAGSKLQLP